MSIERAADDAWRGRIEAFLPHPDLLDGWPEHRRLKNAKLAQPLYHGDGCRGLNGLYAIVNAIRIVLARRRPLTDREDEGLIEAGLRFLETHVSLAACCAHGIRFQLWSRLAVALAYIAEQRFQLPVHLEQPFRWARSVNREEAIGILEMMVVREKAAVVMRRGGLFSVVSGYTPSSILLVDSGGARCIRRRSCGIVQDAELSRHRLCPWSITALSSI